MTVYRSYKKKKNLFGIMLKFCLIRENIFLSLLRTNLLWKHYSINNLKKNKNHNTNIKYCSVSNIFVSISKKNIENKIKNSESQQQ